MDSDFRRSVSFPLTSGEDLEILHQNQNFGILFYGKCICRDTKLLITSPVVTLQLTAFHETKKLRAKEANRSTSWLVHTPHNLDESKPNVQCQSRNYAPIASLLQPVCVYSSYEARFRPHTSSRSCNPGLESELDEDDKEAAGAGTDAGGADRTRASSSSS